MKILSVHHLNEHGTRLQNRFNRKMFIAGIKDK